MDFAKILSKTDLINSFGDRYPNRLIHNPKTFSIFALAVEMTA
jgi:hypothetical protein